MNPYLDFQQLQPSEMIDYGVMVYHGDFSVPQVAAMSRGQHAEEMIAQGRAEQALYLTREATELDFDEIVSQTARGDAAVAIGAKNEARAAWKEAIASAQHMDSEAQKSYIPDLERKLQRLD
jgi:predicted negative regulator of RcsB-dependent stress response